MCGVDNFLAYRVSPSIFHLALRVDLLITHLALRVTQGLLATTVEQREYVLYRDVKKTGGTMTASGSMSLKAPAIWHKSAATQVRRLRAKWAQVQKESSGTKGL